MKEKPDYLNYVRKGKEKKFVRMCKINSIGFYGCSVVLSAHLIMRDLVRHRDKLWKQTKTTPKEAWEHGIKGIGHSGFTASATALTVKEFGVRGREFWAWYKKEYVT